jgi:hypothetical protein
MRFRSLTTLFALSIGLAASSQSQNSDTLQTLKNSLSSDQQSSILQEVLGKGGASGKKTDQKLDTPETVRRKNGDQSDLFDKEKFQKTLDGRTLRQFDEDPELRANDTVLIEVISRDDLCASGINPNQPGDPNNPGGASIKSGSNPGTAAAGLSGLGTAGGAPGSNGIRGVNGNVPNTEFSNTRCPLTDKSKTELEREKSEKLRSRILDNNPYRLNRFGVLEMPGLPTIQLAGLTASEATKRLGADPDLADFAVRVTLLRLLPSGDEALKPFGYDLF